MPNFEDEKDPARFATGAQARVATQRHPAPAPSAEFLIGDDRGPAVSQAARSTIAAKMWSSAGSSGWSRS